MISAVVVTFNKLELLTECIQAISEQTVQVDKLIIVDNASQDGTVEYLQQLAKEQERLVPIYLKENIGGAGGFNRGVKEAMKLQTDYIWIMDDDTIPTPTALEELVKAKDEIGADQFSYLASNVRWIDGEACLMNIPKVAQNWNAHPKYVQLEFSSFVSMFVNAKAVKEVGYPITDFFIWGDDAEYAMRLGRALPGYYVPQSIVIHKMKANNCTNILTDQKERLNRYFYAYRNGFYNARQVGKKSAVKYFINKGIIESVKVLVSKTENKLLKVKTIQKGIWSGMFYKPTVEQYDGEHNDGKNK